MVDSKSIPFSYRTENLVYRTYAAYRHKSRGEFYLRFAEVKRFPSFLELLGNNNGIRKNLSLSSELTRSGSAGWNHSVRDISFGSTIFVNDFKKPIRLVYLSPPDLQFKNLHDYYSFGGELFVHINRKYFSVHNNWTWMEAEITRSPLRGNRPQFTHPWENFFEAVIKPHSILSLGINIEYKSSYYSSDYNLADQLTGSCLLFGTYVDWRYKNISLGFNAFNLTNEYYQDFRYNPNSGMSFSITTQFTI